MRESTKMIRSFSLVVAAGVGTVSGLAAEPGPSPIPLDQGTPWVYEANRADGWYCWRVEAREVKPIRVEGVPRAKGEVVFTVAFRTNPSHELFEIVPGIGIVRYEFEHHGTVASSDVRLIEFKRPPPRRSAKTADQPAP